MDFRQLQAEQAKWAEHNFGDQPPEISFLGVVEEVGELAHTILKRKQGIRTSEDHEAKGKDAVGDILIFLADFCTRSGWDLQEIIEQTWAEVSQRDWKANPVTAKKDAP